MLKKKKRTSLQPTPPKGLRYQSSVESTLQQETLSVNSPGAAPLAQTLQEVGGGESQLGECKVTAGDKQTVTRGDRMPK